MTVTAASSPHKQQRQGLDQPLGQFVRPEENAEKRRYKLVRDVAGMFKFRFIRKIIDLLPKVLHATSLLDLSAVPHGEGKEKYMYDPANEGVTQSGCIPGYDLVDTSGLIDHISRTIPDAVLVPKGCFDAKIRVPKNESSSTDNDKFKYNYMPYAEIVWEFKPTLAHDPFTDKINEIIGDGTTPFDPNQLENDTKLGIKTRGQLTDYATQLMSLQHRTHVFMIGVFGDKARIMRWDRSGAMVSDLFDYKSPKDNHLAEFLWRYSHASRSQRGFDDTVVEATPSEIQSFTRKAREFLKGFGPENKEYRRKLEASVVDSDYVAYKVTFKTTTMIEKKVTIKKKVVTKTEVVETVNHYIVRRPFAEVLSPCGRSTRGYLAYYVEGKRAVFLKDTWRTFTEGIPEEAKIYDILFEAGVPHLPVVLQSGDVYNLEGELQETLTDIDNGDEDLTWIPIALRHHMHHRIAQELALPISFVRNSKQLVQAIRDVLETILKAFQAGYLLRDISSGNVMLTREFEGILNDWDHGIQYPRQHTTRPYRTGTWAFMSIDLLQEARKEHFITDDVESCYWLLLFIASRYFEGGIRADSNIWDQVGETTGSNGKPVVSGGDEKLKFIQKKKKLTKLSWKSKPLTR